MPPLAPAAEDSEPAPRPRWLLPLAAFGASGVLGAVIALTFFFGREAPEIAPEPVAATRAPQSSAPSAAAPTGAVVIAAAAPAAPRPSLPPPVASAPLAAPQPAATASEGSERSDDSSHHHHSRRAERSKQSMPDKPSRAEVIAAMSRVQRQVKACFPSGRGSLTADLTVLGRTGRVTTAQIDGQTGSIGSCIAHAVRKAKFPKFSDETLSVRYPMRF